MTWTAYERRYRVLSARMEKVIREAVEEWPEAEVWEDDGEDYGWHALLTREDGNKLDVSLLLIDAHDASGDHAAEVAGALRLDLIEDGGGIVGGMAPYNYTSDVWTRYRNAAEFNRRMTFFEDAVFDIACAIEEWTPESVLA